MNEPLRIPTPPARAPRAALALAVALLAASAHAPAAPQTKTIDPGLLYHNYCSVCHGDRGDGRSRASRSLSPPPYDFTGERARRELTRERVIAVITHGKPGTAMVGWSAQLNEREIAALADYLMANFVQPGKKVEPTRGRQVYARHCAVCHGDDGRGGRYGAGLARKPRDFTAPEARGLTREAMIEAVTQGKPGTPMAGFASQLSKNDIAAVVDFVRAEFMSAPLSGVSGSRAHGGREADAAQPAHADRSLPFAKGLQGNVQRGAKLYQRNCVACHGEKGDGQGPRAYFIFPKPRNFLEPAARARYNRPALFAGVAYGRTGTEMPAWNKVLTDQEIADVSEYVFQTFVQPQAQLGKTRR